MLGEARKFSKEVRAPSKSRHTNTSISQHDTSNSSAHWSDMTSKPRWEKPEIIPMGENGALRKVLREASPLYKWMEPSFLQLRWDKSYYKLEFKNILLACLARSTLSRNGKKASELRATALSCLIHWSRSDDVSCSGGFSSILSQAEVSMSCN